MSNARLPKPVLYSELETGKRKVGRLKLRYEDAAKRNLRDCQLPTDFENHAANRDQWRRLVKGGCDRLSKERIEERLQARMRRKAPELADNPGLRCHVCQQPCKGRAGLSAHMRAYNR